MSDNKVDIVITAKDRAGRVVNRLTGDLSDQKKTFMALDNQIKRNNQSLAAMGLAYNPPIIKTKILTTRMDKLRGRLVKLRPVFTKAFKGIPGIVGRVSDRIFNLRLGIVALAGSAGLGLLLGKLIGTASSFEDLRTQLDALQGSSEAGRKAVEWIKEFAAKTPQSMQEVTQAFVLARAFGLDPMDGTMQSLVDINAKLGGKMEKLISITRGVGQMFTKNKIQAQEMNLQLTEQGVPAWELLAKAMNRANSTTRFTTSTLQEMSSRGELGRDAIKLLIEEMGRFGSGAALAKMTTFTGLFSNFGDAVSKGTDEFAKADRGLFLFVRGALSTGIKALDKFRETGRLKDFGKNIGDSLFNAAEAVLLGTSSIVAALSPIFSTTVDGMNLLLTGFNNMPVWMKPLGILGAMVLGPKLILGASLVLGAIDPILEALDSLVPKTEGTGAFVGPIAGLTKFLEDLAAAGDNANAPLLKLAAGDGALAAVAGLIRDARVEFEKFSNAPPPPDTSDNKKPKSPTDADILSLDLRSETEKRFQEELGRKIQAQAAFEFSSAEFDTLAKEGELERQNNHLQQLFELDQESADKRLKLADELEKKKKALREGFASQTLGTASNLFNALFILTGSKNKSLFNLIKVANIAQATIDTYTAATSAMKTVPYPFNIAAAASITALGLANVTRISQTSLGGGAAGGGGGSTGTAAPSVSVPTGFPQQNQQAQATKVDVTIHTNDAKSFLDNIDEVKEQVAEMLTDHVGAGGATGTFNFAGVRQ